MKFKDKIERQRNHLTALTTVKTDTPFWIGLSTGELRTKLIFDGWQLTRDAQC